MGEDERLCGVWVVRWDSLDELSEDDLVEGIVNALCNEDVCESYLQSSHCL